MVRRGSTVRVRQRALHESATAVTLWIAGTPQEGQYGNYAAVVVGRLPQPELQKDMPDVRLDGFRAQEELSADRLVRAPFGHQFQDLALALTELGERAAFPAAHEARHDRGVDDALALAHTSNGVGEH